MARVFGGERERHDKDGETEDRERNDSHASSLISFSAFSNQNGMFMSQYIVRRGGEVLLSFAPLAYAPVELAEASGRMPNLSTSAIA